VHAEATANSKFDQVLAELSKVSERQARFKETRQISFLTDALHSKGKLLYKRPDYIYKETTSPTRESYEVKNALLTATTSNGERHELLLNNYPVLESFVNAYRGVLAGDKALLLYYYDVDFSGNRQSWVITLTPKDEEAQLHVEKMSVTGKHNHLVKITTYETGGDVTIMDIFDIQ